MGYFIHPSLPNFMVVALFVSSVVLHLHLKLDTHFAETYQQPCQQMMDLPDHAQRQLLGQQQQQQIQIQMQKQQEALPVADALPVPAPLEPAAGLHAPNSKTLPVPNENGIIIFYMHIPKTGGTSLMAPFVQHPDWRYRMVYGPGKQKRYSKEMYELLEHWEPGSQVYYEYHAGKASPYMHTQVRQDLLVWKAMAKVQNIPFFAFTVVREPLSMAVSHFNFYYASGDKKDPRYFWRPEATEADLMELGVPNPQCLFCVKSEVAYYESFRTEGNSLHLDESECTDVYQAFVHDFEWIGTTDTLSTQTFPILEQLGRVRFCPEVRNKSTERVRKTNLSPDALEFVKTTTSYDQAMYDQAKLDFPLSMWKNFDPPPGPPPLHPRKKRCVYKTGQAMPPGELPKRAGERRRFLEKNPGFVEVKE